MQWKIQQHNGFCTLIITNISVMLEEHNIDLSKGINLPKLKYIDVN